MAEQWYDSAEGAGHERWRTSTDHLAPPTRDHRRDSGGALECNLDYLAYWCWSHVDGGHKDLDWATWLRVGATRAARRLGATSLGRLAGNDCPPRREFYPMGHRPLRSVV